jgi:hypothetical protein
MEDRVSEKRLIWHGYVHRMEGRRLAGQALRWSPVRYCRRGGSRRVWNEDATKY